MRRCHCNIRTFLLAIAIAVAMGVAGCGAASAPAPGTSKPPTPPVDPAVAFTQYEKAATPWECSRAFAAMIDAARKPDHAAVKDHSGAQRDIVATWDTELGAIAFPTAEQPIIDRMRQHNTAELSTLAELVGVDVKDAERVDALELQVELVEALLSVEGDGLRAALGHPVPPAGVAADQLQVADLRFYQSTVDASAKWKSALAANDLNAAKAANVIEEDAAQVYLDRLGTIDWPPGFDDQVNALRNRLHERIDFDRRQVDVATTAQIVQGTPEQAAAVSDTETALWRHLVQAYRQADPASACPPA